MTHGPRNTDSPALPSSLEVPQAVFPPADSLGDKYQAALLLVAVLRDAHPHIDVAAWLRHLHAALS